MRILVFVFDVTKKLACVQNRQIGTLWDTEFDLENLDTDFDRLLDRDCLLALRLRDVVRDLDGDIDFDCDFDCDCDFDRDEERLEDFEADSEPLSVLERE